MKGSKEWGTIISAAENIVNSAIRYSNGGIRIDSRPALYGQYTTFTKEIIDANILEIEVGTTGGMGGDAGHGCETYFRIKDLASTAMDIEVSQSKRELALTLKGDAELSTFIDALEFAVFVLKQQGGYKEEGD